MDMYGLLFVFLVSACCSEHVRANGCANIPPNQPKGQVINICEENAVTVSGYFYMSGSSAEMGNMSRCNCSIEALTQEARLSGISSAVKAPQFTQCNATWHIRGSREDTFTCHNWINFYTDMNASTVIIDVGRQILDDFDFCIYMARRDSIVGDSYNVTCENDGTSHLTTATLPAESNTSSTASTAKDATTSGPSMTSPGSPSPPLSSSMTSQISSTLSQTASSTGTEITSPTATTSATLTLSVSSRHTGNSEMFASSNTVMTSTAATELVTQPTSAPASVFPVVAVAAGIGGGVFLIIIIILIVVLCMHRRRRREREKLSMPAEAMIPRRPPDPSACLQDNPLYWSGPSLKQPSGLSNSNPAPSHSDFMVDNVLYESSSSKKPSSDFNGSPVPNPDDFMVDNILYESSSAVKVNGAAAHPDQSSPSTHSQEPITDAGRGGGQLGTGNNPAVKGLQDLPSRKENGGGMKEIMPRLQYAPPAPPASAGVTASTESPSDGPTPGLTYVAVDFGRGTAMASSHSSEPPTEYTTIDIDATKKLSVVC